MNKYSKLKNFFAGYFHEDWVMDADEPEEIVRMFARSCGEKEAGEVAQQIEAFLNDQNETLSDVDMLHELGCYYSPSADGISADAWLRSVACLLRETN
jgi:hypothetical protein